MGIVQSPTQLSGTVGVYPNFKYMVTTDNLATITTAGYLNQITLESNPITTNDVLQVLYSYNIVTQQGTYEAFSVSITNGVITISQASFAGQVSLPTIANNLIVSTNVGGGLANRTGTAINAGSLQAGSSSVAGTLISYSGTANKGSLIIAGVANTGNTNTTISNAAMGQATVVSIPDPGTATANFVIAPSALVSGNYLQASGTAGLVIDSGVPANGYAQVAVTATQFNGMYAAPVLLVAAPGANKMIIVDSIALVMTYGSAAFAAGGVVAAQYDSTANGAGVIASTTEAAADFFATASTVFKLNSGAVLSPFTTCANKGLYLSNVTQAFTTGTGSAFIVKVYYHVISTIA